jgi:mersacidin/lichenicidin family type 2 lantibiotic
MQITQEMILKAWNDDQYRQGLPPEIRDEIGDKPGRDGGAELSDEQLQAAAGGIAGSLAASYVDSGSVDGQGSP